ncbi:aminotransferase V [Saccharospirillum sp. MSK14-1]|uniref:pyridoxal-phosphate-dependent aminotransferase family protein n=1 Tax=Saccharospirillum sp. MSK14-1 TaxID=1897632 RepID=UPI000D3709A5|nr:alanine--glyoxylate aminotransferase family protein [Saccharospirillum sp. MSK14-1]PTY35823.1 aminotransferase V [Saccharospirillum sp. MSK14-1]
MSAPEQHRLNPPPRLLMGPGPINAYPRVLNALSTQLIGQYDPVMTGYMNDVMALYRGVFDTQNHWTFMVDGTARAGIEAVLVSVIEPGDKVLVPVMGRFGHLLVEIAERAGAQVHTIDVPWGEVAQPEQVEAAIKTVQPKLLATVQGDTSTTMLQPLAELGALCQQYDVLFYCDATASIGGNTLKTDEWGLDAVSAGLQKCLGGPSGIAPITLSDRFVEVIRRRHHIEAGLRASDVDEELGPRIHSNYFDLPMILDYWSEKRLNHHTEATSMLYCARECGQIMAEEGLDACVERHRLHGNAMLAGLTAMNLKPYGDLSQRMNNVCAVYIPEGIDGEAVRAVLLNDFNIEIGTSFGPLAGKVWRVGTMGYNARLDAVLSTLSALEHCLRRAGHSFTAGAGIDAAYQSYRSPA